MKTNDSNNRKAIKPLLGALFSCIIWLQPVSAQICSSPATVIYGLSYTGEIRPITVSDAAVGAAITPSYGNGNNAANQSNALGYNAVNGSFYFFKRNSSVGNQQFVSFNPASGTVSTLASCPTTNATHTGCVSFSGDGYYAMDAAGRLYYYNINLNTWQLITSTFYDQSGTNITATLAAQSGGDVAIDGLGNLWILSSSSSNYGLYKVSAPLPITPVASITATQIIAPTALTPTGNGFAGIAFNTTGQIFLTTFIDNQLYRLENNYTLTNLGTLSVSYTGIDLTSCNFPMTVLAASQQTFTATVKNARQVMLTWTDAAQNNNDMYYIEHSSNEVNWEEIGSMHRNGEKYTYIHTNPLPGNQYYRIRQVTLNGQTSYSVIRQVALNTNNEVAVWPNPAKDIAYINSNTTCTARLFDQLGRQVYTATIQPGVNTLNMQVIPAGIYIVHMQAAAGQIHTRQLVKQ